MMRKLWVVLLVLIFIVGSVGGFWSRPVSANTGSERRVMLCAAEPWNDDLPMANNPIPPDTSALSNTGNRVRMQNAQQSSAPNKTDSKTRNLFYRTLRTLWGMIFPESF